MVEPGQPAPTLRAADFDAFTFDCYGTLVDWESGILAVLHERLDLARAARPVTDDELLALHARCEARREQERPSAPYPDVLAAVYTDVARELGLPADDAGRRAYAGSVGDWLPFPDAAPALTALRRHGRLGVLSNVDGASFARTAERLGVPLDFVWTAQDIGSYKPDPRNFAHAIGALAGAGIERSRVLHVAESLRHDVVPARAAGLRCAWVDRRAGRGGGASGGGDAAAAAPELTVASLAELVAVLGA
ncbi:MAG: HAD-IA family hydrolase [Planctomycetes bacterium]|nr:HAD-IA family hydrolase [Planctomycetota bacterium]